MSDKISTKVAEIELTYRSKTRASSRPQIRSSDDAYQILKANWSDQVELVEEFNILLLDRSNRVMGMYHASKGGVSGTVVDLKIVFAAAITGRASGLILAHNHPSGNLQPSHADIDLTRRFKDAGNIMDIPILDHIIVTPEDGYYSFADECLL